MAHFGRRLRLVSLSLLVGAAFASCSNGPSNGGSGAAPQPVSQTTQLCQVPALQQLNVVKHPPHSICLRDSVSMINFSEAVGISDFNIVAGDIVALDHSSVDMGGAVFLDGSIYLNDDAHFHYAGADIVTGVVKHVDESSNSQMIASFIDSLDAMTPTQDFDTIYTTTVIHSGGPVNVIGIDHIALFDHQRILLDGAPQDVFILNVSGDISTGGDGSGIYLSRDLNPRNVIINNIGHGKPVWIGGYDVIHGTLIAGHRSILVAGANYIEGALVAGKGISLIGPHGIWSPAGFCIGGTPNPDPSPSPSGSPTTTPTGSPTTTPTGSPTCVPASPTPSPSDTSSPEPTPSDSASPSPSPSCDDVVCGGGPIGI